MLIKKYRTIFVSFNILFNLSTKIIYVLIFLSKYFCKNLFFRDNREMKQQKYTFSQLKNYAEWYYFRYFPSNARLLQKLREKGDEDDVQKVFAYMLPLTQEPAIIETKIEGYIARNKNFSYIEEKMLEKLFPADQIQKYLKKYKECGKSLYRESYLRKKIETYFEK